MFKLIIALSLFISLTVEARDYKAYLVVNLDTMKLIEGKNIHTKLPIASLTKLMTINLALKGNLSKKILVGQRAAREKPSKLGLHSGDLVTKEQLLEAALIYSANDAAEALGESSGSIKGMNREAGKLGMKDTRYFTFNGYPKLRTYDISTCYDLALLSRQLIRHKQILKIASKPFFEYKHKKFKNHNRLLKISSEIEGLKTGFFRKAGYNIIVTFETASWQRVAVIVLGSSTRQIRDSFTLRTVRKYL